LHSPPTNYIHGTFHRAIRRAILLALALSSLWSRTLGAAPPASVDSTRPRLIVETDAGGDPDDEQSLVRFLLYANEWELEAIIANRPVARDGENRNSVRSGLGIVQQLVRAYGSCQPQLVQHDPRYPSVEDMLPRVVPGYDDRDDGVARVLEALASSDPRPLWFLNWGTDRGSSTSSLVRALDRLRTQSGDLAYAEAKRRLRVVCQTPEFGAHVRELDPPFSLLVDTFSPEQAGRRWYHRFSAITAQAGGFDLQRDVLQDHGPLGALYPTNTTHPQKEGDSMTFLYLVPTGMNDPEQPTWGSWAGRYGRQRSDEDRPYYWANQADTWHGSTDRENSLHRWAADLQNDFRARLDWCVMAPAAANHPPQVTVDGDLSRAIQHRQVAAGDRLTLDASATTDPDGDVLYFHWQVYAEAGSYAGSVSLAGDTTPQLSVTVPADAAGRSIHLLLTVRDHGSPPLARYRRVVIQVSATATED